MCWSRYTEIPPSTRRRLISAMASRSVPSGSDDGEPVRPDLHVRRRTRCPRAGRRPGRGRSTRPGPRRRTRRAAARSGPAGSPCHGPRWPRRRRCARPRRGDARTAPRCGPRRRGTGSCRACRACPPGRGRSSARRGSAVGDPRGGRRRRPAAGACPWSTSTPCRWRGAGCRRARAPGSMRPLAAGSRAAARICRFWRPVRWPWKRGSSTMAPTRASARSRWRGTA